VSLAAFLAQNLYHSQYCGDSAVEPYFLYWDGCSQNYFECSLQNAFRHAMTHEIYKDINKIFHSLLQLYEL
jgi:hypothetical protein